MMMMRYTHIGMTGTASARVQSNVMVIDRRGGPRPVLRQKFTEVEVKTLVLKKEEKAAGN